MLSAEHYLAANMWHLAHIAVADVVGAIAMVNVGMVPDTALLHAPKAMHTLTLHLRAPFW